MTSDDSWGDPLRPSRHPTQRSGRRSIRLHLTDALAADLAALNHALDEPDVDLQEQLQTLTADLRRAVDSYLGLRMTFTLSASELSFTACVEGPPDARSPAHCCCH
ncbi:MAG: hypothetical protein M3N95_18050 [Actinomycetota bacterium]|nr:hypothetical protein [Actinomycetota bacterium]